MCFTGATALDRNETTELSKQNVMPYILSLKRGIQIYTNKVNERSGSEGKQETHRMNHSEESVLSPAVTQISFSLLYVNLLHYSLTIQPLL